MFSSLKLISFKSIFALKLDEKISSISILALRLKRFVFNEASSIKRLSFDPEKFISPEIKSDNLRSLEITFNISWVSLYLIFDLLNLFILKLSSR